MKIIDNYDIPQGFESCQAVDNYNFSLKKQRLRKNNNDKLS